MGISFCIFAISTIHIQLVLQNTSLFFGQFSVVCVPLPPTSHFGFPDFKRDLEFLKKSDSDRNSYFISSSSGLDDGSMKYSTVCYKRA